MAYCSTPEREQLFLAPKWASDYRRSPRMALDSGSMSRNGDAVAKIAAWAQENLSPEERAALARALNTGAADFMLTSASAARETKSLAGPKAAAPSRDGEPIMSKVEQRDAIIRWLQSRGISDEDCLRVSAMLGDQTAAADLPEAKGAHDSARRRHYRELVGQGINARDAWIAADSLAKIGRKPASAPVASKAALAAARVERFPSASSISVNNWGTPVPPRKATFDSKAQSGFAERYPAAMKVRLGG